MSESHAATRRRSIPGLLLELLMIVVGVFLGASAEQWRETRHHHDLATASLRNFRREIAANRANIAEFKDYHVAMRKGANEFIESKGPHTLGDLAKLTHFAGMKTVTFEHTAWDLALATQALSDIEPALAYRLSRVYTVQQEFSTMEHDFMQNSFTPQNMANVKDASGLGLAMVLYLGDVTAQEPTLIKAYDKLLPQIDSALGGPPPPALKPKPTAQAPKPSTP
jgi:hypothetical protein